MAILKLKAPCKDYIWGGNRLREEYGKQLDSDRIAESWELSCHKDGQSVITGGEFDGKTLPDYIERQRVRASSARTAAVSSTSRC